ncbi:MAG: V-type ATPase subunit [Clostridiales bacterium]|jgi:V/A-type H+-transporting ATPase subunit C|nr:V-type ATPase subunit [Clostridiales bacterium]
MGKINSEAYLYATGRIRVMETRMIGTSSLDRLIDAKTDPEAYKVFGDMGLELPGDETTAEDILAKSRETTFRELESFLPDKRLLLLFRIKYDYHNLKAAFKAPDRLAALYMPAGTWSIERVRKIAAEEYEGLPESAASGIREARETYTRTGDPQLLDFALDRVMFAECLNIATEMGLQTVIGYVKLLIDRANLISYVRARRLGRGYHMLRQVLIPGGNCDTTELLHDTTGESLAKVFGKVLPESVDAARETLSGTGSVTRVEQAGERRTEAYIKDAARQTFGEGVALSYLYGQELALQRVRVILAGRRGGLTPAQLRERL